jgi:hypothetical protein
MAFISLRNRDCQRNPGAARGSRFLPMSSVIVLKWGARKPSMFRRRGVKKTRFGVWPVFDLRRLIMVSAAPLLSPGPLSATIHMYSIN